MEIADGFKQLEDLPSVELPEDASDDAFGKINKALADIGRVSDGATAVARSATQKAVELRVKRNALKTVYEVKKAKLLAEDEEVMAGKNAEQRSAMADMKLKAERVAMEKADAVSREADSLLTACDYVLSNAKTQKELAGHKLNISQKEIELGLVTPASMKGGQ